MSRDLFLESLKSQAIGNHQRWSAMGLPEKRKNINEFGYALDVDMENDDQDTIDVESEEDEMPMHNSSQFMDTGDVALNPARLQMASKGIAHNDEPPLAAIRRKMMDAEPKQKQSLRPEQVRLEIEEIQSDLAGIMSRLKNLLNQI